MGAGLTLLIMIPSHDDWHYWAYNRNPRSAIPIRSSRSRNNPHPTIIGIMMLVSAVSCGMSTANGGTLAIASVLSRNMLQRNIIKHILKRPGLSDRQLLIATRLFVIPMFFTAFALGCIIPRPGGYLVIAFDIVLAWLPLFHWFWEHTGKNLLLLEQCFNCCWFDSEVDLVLHDKYCTL